MATKAYFMIDLKKELCPGGRIEDIIADLETISEVRCVEPIDGACDLLVEIEAPIRVVFVANKLLTKDWVKNLRILKVEPFPTSAFEKLAVHHVLKARRRHPQLARNKPVSITKVVEGTQIAKNSLGSSTGQRRSVLEEVEHIIKRRT